MKLNALNLLSQNLTKILTSKLPLLADNWWQSLIIDKLTYQQQNRLREYGYQAIEQLDLAALLRVVDQNWYDLNTVINCTKETRNWLKEAQAIRNRWAHAPAEGLPDDICYRDLDTIERLLQAFQADVKILEQIKLEKKYLISKMLQLA